MTHRPLLIFAFLMLIVTQHVKGGSADTLSAITTDRARYSPGDTVTFTVAIGAAQDSAALHVRYWHLGDVIGAETHVLQGVSSVTWMWIAPEEDFRGYVVEIVLTRGADTLSRGAIAVDVSSSWNRFPRYGFLSSFPYMETSAMSSVVSSLNRYHINGLQFYDWQYKHHMPLKGTVASPADTWLDIANRTIYLSTVKGYIDLAHQFAMKAMAYNLLYGSYTNAYEDGVDPTWSLYTDTNRTRLYYDLPSTWASDIYVMDPTNSNWKKYLLAQELKAFEAIPFDGWHVDQLGDEGTVYNYSKAKVYLQYAFYQFLAEAKDSLGVELVCNAVNQYGQASIGASPVSFLYTEVWDPNTTFAQLASIIQANSSYGSGKLASVLAAYVNYALADNAGYFNTPAVLYADAVIFAQGGAHLELGEHMLGKEYFPNSNLQMKADLLAALPAYYDMLTGYENLLRDSLSSSTLSIATTGSVPVSTSPKSNAIWYFARSRGDRQIIHLINYMNTATMQWRDNSGIQVEPSTLTAVQLQFVASQSVKRIWCASPDTLGGVPQEITFVQTGDTVSFSVPQLVYWDMVVVEYGTGSSAVSLSQRLLPKEFSLSQNYPNPFNPTTVISGQWSVDSRVRLVVYDVLGREVAMLANGRYPAGRYSFTFDARGLASGMYFYRLTAGGFVSTKRMILVR